MRISAHAAIRIVLPLLVVATLVGCSSTDVDQPAATRVATPEETVILISVDGFRSHYAQWFDTPNIDRLIEGGVFADSGMIPVYPTKTFPNHYTIVTGLYPANHGVVSNSMVDTEMGEMFAISNRQAVENPEWWKYGEPIWTAVQKQGGIAGTYFWVGSESAYDGVSPRYWYRYDGSVPGNDRVDQALTWLDMPDEDRPMFISLYFSEVDDAGHRYGPRADETAAALANVDGYLGRLIDGLEERDLFGKVNIVLVSDHGMSQLSPDRVVALDDYIDLDDLMFIDSNPLIGLHPKEGRTQEVFDALNGAHPDLHVWLRDDLPAKFNYSGHHRIPPIVGHVSDGWSVARTRAFVDANPQNYSGGTHGYDNELTSMRATFIAHGAAFQNGVTVDPFVSVEIYNLMAGIMGIDPSPNDGTAGSLDAILN